MNGYRRYTDPDGRAVVVALWDFEYSAEVLDGGDVVDLVEGSQTGLSVVAADRGWVLETERRIP